MYQKLLLSALVLGANGMAVAADWPSGYKKCATEGATCQAGSVARSVSFGIKNKWVTKTLTGTIACNRQTFGSDPYPGEVKKCAIGPIQSSPKPPVTPAPPTAPVPPTTPPKPTPSTNSNAILETAPNDGWAGEKGGTLGGAQATSDNIHTVSSPSKLLSVLAAAGDKPKIIKISGTIDMASADNGGAFKSKSDQAKRSVIKIPSNTTIIGLGSDAKFVNTSLKISNANSVIVRNLTLVAPCDIQPIWDPTDGKAGNWNSEYDAMTIEASSHVWVDHNRFTDFPKTDDLLPVENGKHKQCHDGNLDVKSGSDFVTISYNIFDQHDKNNLIGSSDSNQAQDNGHLTVTFHHNHFTNIVQRAPRVRFGMVHLYNNYHQSDKLSKAYPYQYSVGVGYLAKIISENNVYDIAGAKDCSSVVVNSGSSSRKGAITDEGSLLNGAALALSSNCSFNSSVGWTVPYKSKLSTSLTSAVNVKQAVLNNAGPGRLSVK